MLGLLLTRAVQGEHSVQKLLLQYPRAGASGTRFIIPFRSRHLASITLTLGLLLLWTPFIRAASWNLSPDFIVEQTVFNDLKAEFPTIDSRADLETLLVELARRYPARRLKARWSGNRWLVTGARAPLISQVDVETSTRLLQDNIINLAEQMVGLVDVPARRNQLEKAIRAYLRQRGYWEPKLQFTEHTDASKLFPSQILTVKLDEGEPCLIEEIDWRVQVPREFAAELQPGNLCDLEVVESQINDLEATLRESGFNQVRINLQGVNYDPTRNTARLTIDGLLGRRIKYKIVDQSKRFLIDDLFVDRELTDIDPAIIGPEAMRSELAQRYQERGFTDVIVTGPTIKQDDPNAFTYTYEVDPGQAYVLSGINFTGNQAFTDSRLTTVMGIDSNWGSSRPLRSQEIEEGLAAVRSFYQEAGFWNIDVSDPGGGQKDAVASTVRLDITIDEGLRHILGQVKISGTQAVSAQEVGALLRGSPGNIVTQSQLVEAKKRIRSLYVERGYLYAKVDLKLRPQTGRSEITVNVAIDISEGPQVRIGRIAINGLVRTRPKVVLRELLFGRGDVYSPNVINLSRQNLARLGLFRSVQINVADRDRLAKEEPILDVIVDLREGRPGRVSFGPGWSLYSGLRYGVEATYANIGGLNRQISVRGSISEERHQTAIGPKTLVGRQIGAGYVEPYLFDWPLDGSLTLAQKAQATSDLWELSFGGEATLSHTLKRWLPGSRISLFYGQKITKTEGRSTKEADLIASDVRISRIGSRVSLDKRDDLRFPTAGYTTDTEISWARYPLGGNLEYFFWEASQSRYFALADLWVLAFDIGLAAFEGINRSGPTYGILPPSERLFSGGSDSVRGYRPRSLGPTVRGPTFATNQDTSEAYWDCGYNHSVLGGNKRFLLKSELRHRWSENFAVTGFVDTGNVFLDEVQASRFTKAYQDPVLPGDQPSGSPCQNLTAYRQVKDNVRYKFADLLRNPKTIWQQNYTSYGTSLNVLTALGAINLAYGLPLSQPRSEDCHRMPATCQNKTDKERHWLLRGVFHLNVGARF